MLSLLFSDVAERKHWTVLTLQKDFLQVKICELDMKALVFGYFENIFTAEIIWVK